MLFVNHEHILHSIFICISITNNKHRTLGYKSEINERRQFNLTHIRSEYEFHVLAGNDVEYKVLSLSFKMKKSIPNKEPQFFPFHIQQFLFV